MATTLHAQNDAERTAHLRKSLEILTPSLTRLRRNPNDCSFLLGVAGPLALGAVVNHHLNNAEASRQCADELKGLFVEHRSVFLRLPSELLYGHAGYLYSLLFVNCHIPSAVDEALLTEVYLYLPSPYICINLTVFLFSSWLPWCLMLGKVVEWLLYPHL